MKSLLRRKPEYTEFPSKRATATTSNTSVFDVEGILSVIFKRARRKPQKTRGKQPPVIKPSSVRGWI
jgi:hypothetical protein